MNLKPVVNSLKLGTKLALLMLVGAATGMILNIGAFLTPRVTAHTAGLVGPERELISALIGAGGGLVAHLFLLPIIGPRFAALNARMQADTWRVPKSPTDEPAKSPPEFSG
jgi:hypothetical protein